MQPLLEEDMETQPVLSWGMGALYGLVNTILTVPCMYGYAAIIFSHPAFASHRTQLTSLVILSSAVHQTVFTSCSTLPFAIGQVQDAGLIFLSSMAGTIADRGVHEGWGVDAILATTLVSLALSTSALGVALIIIGQLRYPSAVCCLLSAVCCPLSAVCCLLSAACCLLPAACCLLPAVRCLLSAVCCLLSIVCCLRYAVCYLLSARCSLLPALCSLTP
jgi:hypothetical protein